MADPKLNITRRGASAFTLIEIIVVVVILAVAALIAVPMMSSAADMQVRGASNRLAADMEYAKNMAITHQHPFTVVFDTSVGSSGYAIQRRNADDNLETILNPISQQSFDVRYASERSLNRVRVIRADFTGADATTAGSVTFDYLGTPHSGLRASNMLNSGEIELRDTGGNLTLTVVVEPMTGYISIE